MLVPSASLVTHTHAHRHTHTPTDTHTHTQTDSSSTRNLVYLSMCTQDRLRMHSNTHLHTPTYRGPIRYPHTYTPEASSAHFYVCLVYVYFF
jgi:hypothetical protein